MTLRELIEQHPELADLPMVVYNGSSGEYDHVGGSASVYRHDSDEDSDYDGEKYDVVVFAGN